jgi:copper chaperone CopZ
MERKVFKVGGLHCQNCTEPLEKALKGTPGVGGVEIDPDAKEVRIEVGEGAPGEEAIKKIIRSAGFVIKG